MCKGRLSTVNFRELRHAGFKIVDFTIYAMARDSYAYLFKMKTFNMGLSGTSWVGVTALGTDGGMCHTDQRSS